MTQTTRLSISMATPLLLPGNRVTHSGELIRVVVTSAMPPLGAFEDDTACVDFMCVGVSTCAICRRCLCEDNQMWWDSAVFSAVAICHIFMLNPTLHKHAEICELHRMNFISNHPPPDTNTTNQTRSTSDCCRDKCWQMKQMTTNETNESQKSQKE